MISITTTSISSHNSIGITKRCLLMFLIAAQLLWANQAFSPTPNTAVAPTQQDTSVFYRNPQDVVDSPPPPAISTTEPKTIGTEEKPKLKKSPRPKPTIHSIKTLDELQYFLEDDDRLVAIKFFAPWCKSCQRLGQHFHKLAAEWGDGVVDRQKVSGKIRFAQVEYSDETKLFLTEQLQIRQVPTLQLYHQKSKLYEEAGMTNTKKLQVALKDVWTMSQAQLAVHAASVDDGILEEAIEEAFFDSPSFLDEEW